MSSTYGLDPENQEAPTWVGTWRVFRSECTGEFQTIGVDSLQHPSTTRSTQAHRAVGLTLISDASRKMPDENSETTCGGCRGRHFLSTPGLS